MCTFLLSTRDHSLDCSVLCKCRYGNCACTVRPPKYISCSLDVQMESASKAQLTVVEKEELATYIVCSMCVPTIVARVKVLAGAN